MVDGGRAVHLPGDLRYMSPRSFRLQRRWGEWTRASPLCRPGRRRRRRLFVCLERFVESSRSCRRPSRGRGDLSVNVRMSETEHLGSRAHSTHRFRTAHGTRRWRRIATQGQHMHHRRLISEPISQIGAAFVRRCIPAGGVARRSNIPDIFAPRALPAGRLAALGAALPSVRLGSSLAVHFTLREVNCWDDACLRVRRNR